MTAPRAVALVLCTAIVVLIAAGTFGMAQRSERASPTPDAYGPYRQTVQAILRATPTPDGYARGRSRVQTAVAGLPTPASSSAWSALRAPSATLGDIYRCAESYARGLVLSWDCNDSGVDACVRGLLSSVGGSPYFGCYGIAAGGRGSFASQYEIKECVWAAFDDNSFSKWTCSD
jgi:hypothetical protein